MLYVIAAVYDSKAKVYLPPVFCSNQQVAQRAFMGAANQRDHQIGANPADFSMFIIGTFDDDTAEIRMFPERINLGLAAQYTKAESDVQH